MAFDTTVIIPRVEAPTVQTGVVSFNAASYSGNEGTTISFTIERALNPTQQLRVDWVITGVPSASPSAGQVQFYAGDLAKTVSIVAGLVTANEVGSLAVTVTALTDTDNPPTTPAAVPFSVTDISSDLIPVITSTPSLGSTFIQGVAGTYDMTQHVSDDGVSPVTYAINGTLAIGLSFNSVTGILEYDGIGPADESSYTLVATDAVGSAESGSFVIPINGIYPIPVSVAQAPNTTLDMSQYIVDAGNIGSNTAVLQSGVALPNPTTNASTQESFVSYDPVTKLLHFDYEGTAQNLQLSVDFGLATTTQWLGDSNKGDEFGALPVNDAWVDTVYEYQRQYAPSITVPEVTGDVSAQIALRNNVVNPNANDEYLAFDLAGFRAAINDPNINKVFVAKGTDLYASTGVDETVTVSGSLGNERWFIWWDTDTNDHSDIRPWDQAQSDRVMLPWNLKCHASYCNFVGFSGGIYGVRSQRGIWFRTSAAHHCIVYRCYGTYHGKSGTFRDGSPQTPPYANGTFMSADDGCAGDITFFEILCEAGYVHIDNVNENDWITINSGGNNNKVISCELSDPSNTNIQLGPSHNWSGTIIEDCDLFKEKRYDNDATGIDDTNPLGNYAQGDSCSGIKKTASSGAGPHAAWYGNRIWGARRTSAGLDTTPTSGPPIVVSDQYVVQKIDIRYNVIWDTSRGGVVALQNPPNAAYSNITIAYNLFADGIPGYGQDYALSLNADNSEFYLNTLSNCWPNQQWCAFWTPPGSVTDNLDLMGNFFKDVGPYSWAGSDRYTDRRVGHNAYAGTYTIDNYVYGNDYELPGATGMGNFTFWRKKLSDPNRLNPDNKITIFGVVPTSNTPIEFRTGTQNAGIGSRSNIGVDDELY
jgi:hypothetical protein